MRFHRFGFSIALPVLMASLVACSKGGAGTEATRAAAAEAPKSGGAAAIQPCNLLTAAQVATVLPGHDGGMVAHAGTSLTKGIEAYQCSYTNGSTGLMTVILNVSHKDEDFSWIKPSEGTHREHRTVNIADGGWVYGDENDLKIEAVKGRTVIDLELMDPGARTRTDALIELARIVAQKIP